MGVGSPGGSRRAISCDTVAATSSSIFATTAVSPSKFVPYSSALGKTVSAAASTTESICLPSRSTELSRKELGAAPLAIVVRPGAGEKSQAHFVGRRLWTPGENRAARLLTTSGDAADGLHVCALISGLGRDSS